MTKRLVASYVTITLVVLALLEIPLGVVFARAEKRNLVAELKHDALALGAIAEETLVGNARDDLEGLARDYEADTGGRVVITNRSGRLVADSSVANPSPREFGTRPEIADALAGREVTGTRRSDTLDTDLLFVAVPVASSGNVVGTVRITYTTSELDARIRRGWLVLGGFGLVVLGATTFVSVLLARSVTRPLRDLEGAAADLAEGDLHARADVRSGPHEVRMVADTFNVMAARLEQLIGSQEEFVADASHQLRTPLQALRLRLENAEASVKSPAAKADLDAALAEVARLNRLVDGLLALARAEREQPAPSPIDVSSVIADRHRAWAPLAGVRGIEVKSDAPDAITALASPGHLEQAIDNLVSNAIEVTPDGGCIDLCAVRLDGWVEVHVIDEGPGMTADERERATGRFWRAPGAKTGGSGIGLAIVDRLTKLDGGSLELREAEHGGLDAVLKLKPR